MKVLQASQIRQARGSGALNGSFQPPDKGEDKENMRPTPKHTLESKPSKIKRDFFGRPIINAMPIPPPEIGAKIDASSIAKATATKGKARHMTEAGAESERIWMSFHEGFSNAVRKPITLSDLMDGF